MEIPFYLRGLLIGFSIAAPVGPIGVLCIRRTLAEGRISGLVSGLGAASADAVYGAIAAFGLTLISASLMAKGDWIRLVGGLFLLYLGFKTFTSKPAEQAASTEGYGLWRDYLSTFFLTLTNPMTILSFTAIFAGLGLGVAGTDYDSALALILGVFSGSALWWLLLSSGVGLFRSRLTTDSLVWVNRLSGLVILGFGSTALLTLTGLV